jgi:hypothetical protein
VADRLRYHAHLVSALPKLDLVADNDVVVFALLPILELEHDESLFPLGALCCLSHPDFQAYDYYSS